MKKIIATALLLTLPLTACAMVENAKIITSGSPHSVTLTATQTPTQTPGQTPTQTPIQTPTATISPTPLSSFSAIKDDSIPKSYRMNKNYDLIPIDPNGNKKIVLLTFDDGPKDKSMIVPMLDTLDKHKAKAIFFMNGYRIKEKPELLKLVYDRGQIIGNHSWDHINLKQQTNEKIDQQIKSNSDYIKELTGAAPTFFRAPFAAANDHVREFAKAEGMLYMTWSDGSLDWALEGQGYDSQTKSKLVITNVFKLLHPGSNILMHELPWTVNTLDDLLTQLEGKGYSFLDPRAIETNTE